MSTYSNNRQPTARAWLARRVPVVHPIEPAGVGAVGAGEEFDRVHIVVVVVVVKDGLADVAGRAIADEQTGGGKDRVVWVHDVAAVAVLPPGSGEELHRPLRTRGRRPVDPAEQALDVVDRREIAGVHAVQP